MYRIDNATAVTPIPAPAAVGPNPNSFFTKGNPALSIPATIVDDDWANAVQEEIANVIEASGLTLSKTVRTQLLSALQGKLARIRLTGNTTFYVATTGNNSNNGTAIGTPWLTLQFAFDSMFKNYDFAGFQVTIQLADGTYAGANLNGVLPGQSSPIIVNGNSVTPANVILNTALGNAGNLQPQNLKSNSTGDNFTSGAGTMTLGVGIIIGATGAGNSQIYANGGTILIGNNYTVSAGAQAHYQCFNGGKIILNGGLTITLTGTPAYSVAFCNMSIQSQFNQSGVCTFTGAATGTRYNGAALSLINTGTGSGTYFPGNVAGAVTTGAVYT